MKPTYTVTIWSKIMSHPSWVCGLKLSSCLTYVTRSSVTPFVGVWIETFRKSSLKSSIPVTPFVGVWIETD